MAQVPAIVRLVDEVRADHRFLNELRGRYDDRFPEGSTDRTPAASAVRVLVDFVGNIGFQQLVMFRLASMLSRARLTLLAMVTTRIIRHLYGAEMHWQADLAPGISLVHGNGIVISREARVGPRCVLFQNVTLGISSDPTGVGPGGAPHLLADVHVGPGAIIVGPIEIGPDSKVAGGTTVMDSVGPGMSVAAAPTVINPRRRAPTRIDDI